ncbi:MULTISPECIES: HK97 gp10 family phage protein [unclassified Adlercreutzia]|uniref:HK97 gp10 family phage protein n=1 Tax=unclassified Adlercreutzia TaxID=2636013 RepID=UPI0013EDA552|nr:MULTISPECIES: HK97 gp10 family phage protein [unclassified Adlercreutzia]
MANKVSYDGFLREFDAILTDFKKQEQEAVNEEVRKAGLQAKKQLRSDTPEGAGQYHDWGEYQRGFSMHADKSALGDLTITIGNKKKASLTHLLEEGHVNANGKGRARAFPHIAPAAETAMKELKRRLGDG